MLPSGAMTEGERKHDARAVWAAVAIASILLVLRKPWALHAPQLWAEDANPFLVENEIDGFAAVFRPYQGYVLLIPRLVALIAGLTRECAWWPGIYNAAALLVAVGVLARMASPRLALPHKPLLVLAFAVAAHTGEAILNQANVQWVSAFFLIQQLLIAPPATRWQVAGDALLMALAGLTGPFSVVLLPFFAWRALRCRHWREWIVAGVVLACAAFQAACMLLWPAGGLGFGLAGFDEKNYLVVLGNRLVVWPFLGQWAALTLAPLAIAAISGVVFAAVGWQVASAKAGRREREVLVVCLMVTLFAAAAWRVRPDTWDIRVIHLGDRYFFVPRILFAWLVVWQLDAARRAVAVAAAILCGLAVLTQPATFMVPAPHDFHWAEQCSAIVEGRPVRIHIPPDGSELVYPGKPR